MSNRRKILTVRDPQTDNDELLDCLRQFYEVVEADSADRALALLHKGGFAGIYAASGAMTGVGVSAGASITDALANACIMRALPDAVVLLDLNNCIEWCNPRMAEWTGRADLIGENFYAAMGDPDILGPELTPFQTAVATGKASISNLGAKNGKFYRLHAQPIADTGGGAPLHLMVTVRDITVETEQQQKLVAIHQAGVRLADLTPEDLRQMSIEQRVELLKSNILQFANEVLHYDVVEIRLLDEETRELKPLLEVGMEPEAASRVLHALAENNGVTGHVAATGKSYLCDNTAQDPHYLKGARDAKSSLTVPLVLHEKVIGTFNVESPTQGAFSESDLQFLEIFGHEVAMALNTLELLVAEQAGTAAAYVEAIHSAVALPVDDILNDAVTVMEKFIGHDSDVAQVLQRILRNARDIKQLIQRVGQKMAPSQAHPQVAAPERPQLKNRHVLVADADDTVRKAAHNLLERYGCIVETAHNGEEALCMVRSMNSSGGYDAIIADIRLPDMNGYDFMMKLQTILDPVPLVLMTGYGYDGAHALTRARSAGLLGVLYKPFRLDQLLDTVERISQLPRPVQQG